MSRPRSRPKLVCGRNAVGISLRDEKRHAARARRAREREALARVREGRPADLPTRYRADIIWRYW